MIFTHLDLFSGIGGFSLAFEQEGFQTIGFSEIDPYASAVLRKHWPNVINYGDIRTIPAIRCDVLTGGFPCQPFSQAGKRRGKEDNRYLWPAMLSVIQRCRPTWVFGENVPGILSMGFDTMLVSLENEGYQCQTFVVPACAVDAPHRRDRVWIVAHAGCERDAEWRESRDTAGNGGSTISDAQGVGRQGQWPRGKQKPRSHDEERLPLCGSEDVSDADKERESRLPIRTEKENSSPGIARSDVANGNLKFGDWWGEGLGWWEREPEEAYRDARERGWIENELPGNQPSLGRVADGIPRKLDRLRCLGNAIVPKVAQVFAKAIMEQLKASCASGHPSQSTSASMPKDL